MLKRLNCYFKEMYPYYIERDRDRDQNRMYYTEPNSHHGNSTQTSNSSTGSNGSNTRNYREFEYYPNPYNGKSPERRRTYMESKYSADKTAGMKELENYIYKKDPKYFQKIFMEL